MTDLWPGERLLGNWAISVIPDPTGLKLNSIATGTLLLTDQRLIFAPDKTKRGEHEIVQVADSVLLVDAHYIALADISGVSMGRQPGTIKVDLANGQNRHYILMASRLSPVWSKKSRSVREEAAEQISKAANEARLLQDMLTCQRVPGSTVCNAQALSEPGRRGL